VIDELGDNARRPADLCVKRVLGRPDNGTPELGDLRLAT
jgi:hypothetical protein